MVRMKQQLSQWQFIFLMMWVVMGNGILFAPAAMAKFVVQDGWISACLLIVAVVILCLIVVLYVRTFATRSLVQSLILTFGPWLGRLLSLYFLLWIFVSTCMFLRKFTFYVEDTLLPLTPPYILAALFILPVAYAVWHGIEVIGRLAVVFAPVSMIVTATLTILMSRHIDLRQITPVLADGWTPILRGATVPWRFGTELLLCLMFLKDVKVGLRSMGINLIIVGLILTFFGVLVEILIVGVLGQQITSSEYPILEAVRTIQLGDFLGRLDSFYTVGTVSLLVLKLTVYQYVLSLTIQELFQLSHYRPILFAVTFILWAGSMIFFPDLPSLDQFGRDAVPAFFVSALVMLPLIAILGMTLQKWMKKLPWSPKV